MTDIGTKTGETILQQSQDIVIGDQTYKVAPARVGTLIRASMEIAKLPDFKLDEENIAFSVMGAAKDCSVLGDIIAIFILGVQGLEKTITEAVTVKKTHLWGLIKYEETTSEERTIDVMAALSKKIINEVSPRELNNIMMRLLATLQISDFFAVTTFLAEINLLRQTREVVNETTASGR